MKNKSEEYEGCKRISYFNSFRFESAQSFARHATSVQHDNIVSVDQCRMLENKSTVYFSQFSTHDPQWSGSDWKRWIIPLVDQHTNSNTFCGQRGSFRHRPGLLSSCCDYLWLSYRIHFSSHVTNCKKVIMYHMWRTWINLTPVWRMSFHFIWHRTFQSYQLNIIHIIYYINAEKISQKIISILQFPLFYISTYIIKI